MQERLVEIVARLSGYAPSELRVDVRTPLEHQSNRLYDARVGERHLLVKEYLKAEEFSTAPLYEHSLWGRVAIVAVGAVTALMASLSGQVSPDAKSGLAYATIAQVGLMFVAVSIGGSPIFVERSEGEDIAAQRVRMLQQRAHVPAEAAHFTVGENPLQPVANLRAIFVIVHRH